MTVLVTGSAGHPGEALMRLLRGRGEAACGFDRRASAFTNLARLVGAKGYHEGVFADGAYPV